MNTISQNSHKQDNTLSPIIVMTTLYGNDGVSHHRIQCVTKTLNILQSRKLRIVIVDGGSTNKDFLRLLKSTKSNLIHVIEGAYSSHREQICCAFHSAINASDSDEDLFLYSEPEKSGLFTDKNFFKIQAHLSKKGIPQEFMSFMRNPFISLPQTQLQTESQTALLINNKIDKFCNYYGEKYTGEKLIEGVGNLFGPFLATRAGIQKILDTGPQSDRDGNEFLFVARILSYLEGLDENINKISYMPLDYSYNYSHEIEPENREWGEISHTLGIQIQDLNLEELQEYSLENPSSIVVKRLLTQKYIWEAVSQAIQKYCSKSK